MLFKAEKNFTVNFLPLVIMEQEVPVTIHQNQESADEAARQHGTYRAPAKDFNETISEAWTQFRESEAGEALSKGSSAAKEYIQQHPTQAMLLSVGAGALLGLLLKRR
uniref:DUF883 domain-containing protein n=1 Tax=Chlorobium chlorochromatii (strain CaD3) TaxID=340177 RepID=Q3ATY9_CHLCH